MVSLKTKEIVHLITSTDEEESVRSYWVVNNPDVELKIELVPEEERLRLINYNEGELDKMSNEEILKRIAALEAIQYAPHYMFAEPKDEKSKRVIENCWNRTLNGNGGIFALELRDYLVKRGKGG